MYGPGVVSTDEGTRDSSEKHDDESDAIINSLDYTRALTMERERERDRKGGLGR